MTVLLETKLASKNYESGGSTVRAVDNADLVIRAGEFAALVGPSGSGKTTMLAMLAALLSPTSGRVILDGQDLGSLSERQKVCIRRQKIGFTFQANNLVPYLTVQENVELMLRLNKKLNKKSRERTVALLERLGLGDNLNRISNQLSGGQKQRATIARSLIHNPSVVLADEPTASLDTERAEQVVKILR